jgi:hypothetical protein
VALRAMASLCHSYGCDSILEAAAEALALCHLSDVSDPSRASQHRHDDKSS